jgi:SAM-dependent methyltransferase
MKNISNYCIDNGIPRNTFIDLGCGNGKTLAYAVCGGFKDAKGSEIVQARYDYAMKAREKMDNYMKDKIKLSKNDIFDLKPDYFPSDSVIFISNLMFPEPTNQELIKHLSKITPASVIIILSKLPSDLYQFKLIEQLNVPMTWNSDSKCYVIKKTN